MFVAGPHFQCGSLKTIGSGVAEAGKQQKTAHSLAAKVLVDGQVLNLHDLLAIFAPQDQVADYLLRGQGDGHQRDAGRMQNVSVKKLVRPWCGKGLSFNAADLADMARMHVGDS